MRNRIKTFQKAKRSGKKAHYIEFKKLRNAVTTLLHFFNSLMGINSKQFWKMVKLFNKQQNSVQTLIEYNIQAVNDKEKANMLNMYFSLCWNNKELPLTDVTAIHTMIMGVREIMETFFAQRKKYIITS